MDNQKVLKTNDNTPEGLAAPGSNSPGKNVVELKKARAKYSGAARRRYKKQLMLEGKARAEKPGPEPKAPAASTPRTGEQASAGATKRPRQELSTPSPSESQQPGKRPRGNPKSYSQAAEGIVRVAIVPMAYPDEKLDKEGSDELKTRVVAAIHGLPRGTKAPTFRGTSDRDGAVIFNCTEDQTAGWLKSLTAELIIKEETQLRALRVDELPKRHRVVVHVEDPKMPVKEILDLLDRQNPGVGDDWVVARGSESRDATSTHFAALIRDGSLRALKALNYKPYCGLGQATVRLIGGERGEETKKSN